MSLSSPDVRPGPSGRLLSSYGEPVDGGAVRQLILGGRHTLWLVTDGVLNLFAVDTVDSGPWHFLGRLEAGTIIVGSFREARHMLAARPERGCRLRRIPLAELADGMRGRHRELTDSPRAIARAIDLGITVLHDSIRGPLPAGEQVALRDSGVVDLSAGQVGRGAGGVLWARVEQGQLRSDGDRLGPETGDTVTIAAQDWIEARTPTTVTLRSTEELLAAGVLWDLLVRRQAQYLVALDHALERRQVAGDARLAAGRQASAGALDLADQTLRTVAQPVTRRPSASPAVAEDAAVMACRLVAKAARITLAGVVPPAGATARVDPITRITAASGIRTRPVRLAGRWWREDAGPMVGYRGPDRLPVALLWRAGRYDLVDPSAGRARVTEDIAAEVDAGAVMFYRSLPERPVTGFRLLRFGLAGSCADVLRMLLGGLVAFGLGLAVPILNGKVLGEFVPNARTDLVVQACLAVLVVGVVSATFSMLSSVAVLRLEGRLDATLQAAIWDRLLRLPATFFARYSTGELASAALGINGIRAVASGIATVAISACLLGVVDFALLLWYSVPLGLMAGGLLITHAAIFITIGIRQIHWQRQLVDLEYALSDRVFQTLRGLPKLRVAGAESFAYARWAADFARSRELARRVQRTQNLVTSINAAYVPFCTFVLFLVLAGPAKGALTLSGFLTFVTAFAATLAAMVQATSTISSAGIVVPMFDKMRPVLAELPEVSAQSLAPDVLTGDIEVRDVSFRYAAGAPLVLEELSLHIRAGEFVAIVGPTGCGKSTLLRLLIGFNQPTSGVIRYDGVDLTHLDLGEVRRQCGVVLQHSVPFSGTMLSNICGTDSYSTDEVWAAATLAGLDQDIKQMPMGLHTLVTDGAGALSGGQRQRMMIAQALIRRPRILFFDEATSALDNETQAIVTRSTAGLSVTRVVIAHRLSTIMGADRVIVMSHGRVAQSGRPAELLDEEAGMFHDLVRRQIQ
jgi:NHLM bacteriocin system ABC transporter ATP-binding protein